MQAVAIALVFLVQNGQAQLPILTGSVAGPAQELQAYIEQMSGSKMELRPAKQGDKGLYVGLAADFPWIQADVKDLGAEGFLIHTDAANGSVYVLAKEKLGVSHGVQALLMELGCRWFFPGKDWQIVPKQDTIKVSLDLRQTPSFTTQRRLWYGFGAYDKCGNDYQEWMRHNRMGGPIPANIGHTFYGLNPEKDFSEHPDWFALVTVKGADGKETKIRKAGKPCYSHPEVIKRATEHALAAAKAAGGKGMVSMSPPDGLGYCECEKCLAVLQGGKPEWISGSLFGKRPDGTLVNVTSETLFHFVNEVAAAVAKEYPDYLLGCYAYSAYSHPPSFKLLPNVYIQTTTAYRRTPLTLEEQLRQWSRQAAMVDLREYWSVYQWDWDGFDPGKMAPSKIQSLLKQYRGYHVTGVNAEASNNWGPRGPGYYAASQLLWNVDADLNVVLADFYQKAFGPAAKPMQRYYERSFRGAKDEKDPVGELDAKAVKKVSLADYLKQAYADLDEAAKLAPEEGGYRQRVDDIRMYVYYLYLRSRVEEAAKTTDKDIIKPAIAAETTFGGRLTYTNMIHSRPLIGKAFLRRFGAFKSWLEADPDTARWRVVGEPPSHEELQQLWEQSEAELAKKP